MKFFIFTTGCKANQWDSYVMGRRLRDAGHEPSAADRADVVVLNSCTLTARAERDARRFIERVKATGRDVSVVLAGCHAQVYPDNDFGADLVLGQEEKFDIAALLGLEGRRAACSAPLHLEEAPTDAGASGRTRFFFKIQDGCDRFCSYCIVPYARGRSRSRSVVEIEATMSSLARRGVKEVVLTGIDLAAYSDPSSGIDLSRLVDLLERWSTPVRIRLSSIDARGLDDRLVGTIRASTKISRSFHIPLQSGSPRVLAAMGRSCDPGMVRDAVARLEDRLGTVGLGMDVMVGFPGEDEAAFRETVAFLEELPVSYLHVFPFSERPGTRAEKLDCKVDEATKKRRVKTLKALDRRKREKFARGFIGREAEVLMEGKLYKGRYARGYTDHYLPVYLPYEKGIENNLITVTIMGMEESLLRGERLCSS